MERATFVTLALSLVTAPARGASAAGGIASPLPIAQLESRYGGRLGVAAIDTRSGATLEHRAHERFAMCSTFKMLLVSDVLRRVDLGQEHLAREVRYGRRDLLDYAPITRAHVGHGAMTVGALCAAAIEVSDNTAANLLLASVGGPAGVTRFVREQGDRITRLDRNEPSLNTAIPGDPRDTTTPASMRGLWVRLLTGHTLGSASRKQLEAWLIASSVGENRLRAGLPHAWRAGDKSGTGAHAATNDVAIALPPGRPPIFIAAYYAGSPAPQATRELVLAETARAVARAFR